MPHNAVLFRPATPDVVFAANDAGMYRSPDGGANWQNLTRKLPTTPVVDLVHHGPGQLPSRRDLRAQFVAAQALIADP